MPGASFGGGIEVARFSGLTSGVIGHEETRRLVTLVKGAEPDAFGILPARVSVEVATDLVNAETRSGTRALEPTASGVGFTSALNRIDTASNGDAATRLVVAVGNARSEFVVPFTKTISVDTDESIRISGRSRARSTSGISVDTAEGESVIPEAEVSCATGRTGSSLSTVSVNRARRSSAIPRTFSGRLARTFKLTLARKNEATFRSDGDSAEEIQRLGVVVDGEGTNNTSSSVGVIVRSRSPLSEGVEEAILIQASGWSQRFTRSPLSKLVDGGRNTGNCDGLTNAIVNGPEVIERTITIVPVPSTGSIKSLSTNPALSLDGSESDGVIEIVGSSETTSGAEQVGGGTKALSGSEGLDGSGGGDGLDEGGVALGVEGLETDGVLKTANNRASGGSTEGDGTLNGIEGSDGIDSGGLGEGSDQGTSSSIKTRGFED